VHAGGEDRPEVAPVLTAARVERGRDPATGALHGLTDLAVKRGLVSRCLGGPLVRQAALAGLTRDGGRGAGAGHAPEVVAGQVPADELVVVGRAGRQEAEGIVRTGVV